MNDTFNELATHRAASRRRAAARSNRGGLAMSLLFPFEPPLADWSGPGPWILLVPLVWFAFALAFVFILRRFAWGRGRGWGPAGCGGRDRWAARRWDEDDSPGSPGEPWRRP